MSGGSMNYFYSYLEGHIGDFNDIELDELVRDLADLFHAREWYLSSDTSEGDWREARDAFKAKWLNGNGSLRKELLESHIAKLRDELLDSFGLSDKYCKNCRHWKPEEGPNDPYGCCDIKTGCLWHRCEQCDRFERKDGEAE